ncbi:lyase family protein [Streptomyces sp. NPDC007369]|uniref:lyase family protein n=1 Tax=Streptomyces sp. NPDC007369 TaxID=3154589 RepID=UPI00340BA060
MEAARAVPHTETAVLYRSPGQPIEPARDFRGRLGHVIVSAREAALARRSADDALRELAGALRPGHRKAQHRAERRGPRDRLRPEPVPRRHGRRARRGAPPHQRGRPRPPGDARRARDRRSGPRRRPATRHRRPAPLGLRRGTGQAHAPGRLPRIRGHADAAARREDGRGNAHRPLPERPQRNDGPAARPPALPAPGGGDRGARGDPPGQGRGAQGLMPAYTHGQPAVPVTYGHYLAGVGCSVLRALDDLLHAGRELDVNPLGAGAVGGTSVAVSPERTSALLGFSGPARNSVDAVASRDFALRPLAAASTLGVTVARVARDLSAWTSEEAGFVRLADDLVGSSSMMPQKRNPFLLEHVQGRATASLGAFTAAASSMATASYTNAIAVGTEALRHTWPGLGNATDAVTLLRLVVRGAEPDVERMLRRAVDGFTPATYPAEQLVAAGMPFRSAHHLVGKTVLHALDTSCSLAEAARDVPEIARLAARAAAPEAAGSGPDAVDRVEDWLQPAAVARACAYGGGPGGDGTVRAVADLRADLEAARAAAEERRTRWAAGAAALDEAAAQLMASFPGASAQP